MLLVATAPFGWFACNILFGIDEPILAQPKVDSGVLESDTGCVPAKWPSAPTTEDGTGDRTFVVALRKIDVDVDPPAPLTGWDLDGVCTCPGPPACVRRYQASPEMGDAGEHCDDPGGRDVTLNREVLKVITQSPSFSTARLNETLETGRYGIIAEIRGYNGGQNDKSVQVALMMSAGTPGDAGPSWDGGSDRWDLDPASLKSGDASPFVPAYIDNTAYVTDGVLVASKLAGVKISLGVGSESIDLDLGQAVFTAKLVPVGSSYALHDGTIAGRWTAANILRAIAPLNAPFIPGNPPLCSPGAKLAYDYAKKTICAAADLSQNPERDKDRGADCDALSFGMRFTSEPAKIGGIRARLGNDAGCPPWTDDCTK
jgi:hypothetical protein